MPTLAEFIRVRKAQGLSDRDIQSEFETTFGQSPIGVDPLAQLPELPPPAPAASPHVSAPTSMEVNDMLAQGFRPVPPVPTTTIPGIAGAAYGAAKLAPALLEPQTYGVNIPYRTGSPESAALRGAFMGPEQAKQSRKDKSLYEKGIESARDFGLGAAKVAYTGMRTAAGLPPVGHQGPYTPKDAFRERQATGRDFAAGVVAVVPGMIASALPVRQNADGSVEFAPSETYDALSSDPVGWGSLALPAAVGGARRLKKPSPHATWTDPGKTTAAARAYRNALSKEPTLTPDVVDMKVKERFPPRREIETPAPGLDTAATEKAAGAVLRGLAGAALGDWITPAAGFLAGVSAPKLLQKAIQRLSPETQAALKEGMFQIKRGMGERWWLMPDEVQTEVTRLITRSGEEVRGEVGLLFRELANRHRDKKADLDKSAPKTELPAATVDAMELTPDGVLQSDTAARRKLEGLEDTVKLSHEEASGLKTAERAAGAEVRRIEKPFRDDARTLRELGSDERGHAKGERAVGDDITSRAKEDARPLREIGEASQEWASRERKKATAAASVKAKAEKQAHKAGMEFQEGVRFTRKEISVELRRRRKELKETRAAAKATTDPRTKKMLVRYAALQKQAIKELREVAAGTFHDTVVAGKAAGHIKRRLNEDLTGVVQPHRDIAAKVQATADQYLALARDIERTGGRNAAPVYAAAARHAAVAKRLFKEAKEKVKEAKDASEPVRTRKEGLKKEKEDAQAVVEQLKDPAERLEKSGMERVEDPVEGWTKIVGDEGIVDRLYEAVNRGAKGRREVKREVVERWASEPLRDSSLSLLYEPSVRGVIYNEVAKAVDPSLAKQVKKAIDNKLVEISQHSVAAKSARSMDLKLPNGQTLKLRDLIDMAMRELESKEPGRAREIRANALERVGVALSGMVAKRTSALEILNELDRVGDSKSTKTHGVNRRLVSEIDGDPVIVSADNAKHLDPDNSKYVDAPPWLGQFVANALQGDQGLPKGTKIHRHAEPILKAHVDVNRVMDDVSKLAMVAQHVTLSQTAYQIATHKGNLAGNITFEALASGLNPATIVKKMAEAAHWYRTSVKSRHASKPDLMEWRGYLKSGAFDTSLVDEAVSSMVHVADTAGPLGAAVKAGKVARRVYKAGDTVFKLMSARRNYAEMMARLDKLADGKSVSMQLRDQKWVNVKKVGAGKFELNGRALSEQGLADVVANTSTVPGLGRYFDYSGGGLWKKKMGVSSAKNPLTNWMTAYFSWPYFATDIPGVKRGLMTNILDDVGGGYWRTDDPALIRDNVKNAFKVGLKRAAMVQAGLSMTRDDRHELAAGVGFSRTQPVVREVFPLPKSVDVRDWTKAKKTEGATSSMTPAEIVTYRQEYPGQATEMLWRAVHGGLDMMFGADYYHKKEDESFVQRYLPGFSLTDRRRAIARIHRKAQSGDIISGRDFTTMLGYGAPLVERLYELTDRKNPDGTPAPIDMDRFFLEASSLITGGSVTDAFKWANGLGSDKAGPFSGRRVVPTDGEWEDGWTFFFRQILRSGAKSVLLDEEFGRKLDARAKFLEKTMTGDLDKRFKRVERLKGKAGRDERKSINRRGLLRMKALRRATKELADESRKATQSAKGKK